jgi:heme exporter protein D
VELGTHAGFIIAAYGASMLIILTLIVWIVADYRAQRRDLAEMERQGVTRRSARTERRPA